MENGTRRALHESRARVAARKNAMSGVLALKRNQEMEWLRSVMFSRRFPGEAFHPLSEIELAILESYVEEYVSRKQLIVLEGSESMDLAYGIIRHNLLSGLGPVSSEEFHSASLNITRNLLRAAIDNFGLVPRDTVVLLAWRAGLVFAEPAHNIGFRDFYHLGACRNEETLETEFYFEEVPATLRGDNSNRKVIITDPMLATGNTAISGILRLEELGVRRENIGLVSVISAPEGVDQVLSRFPGVRILAGSHDERLNSRGFIVPGLGDFGDQYFEGVTAKDLELWRSSGVLGVEAFQALQTRMQALQSTS